MSLFSDTGEVSLKLCRLCPASQPTKKGSLLAPFLRVANASHEASRTCAADIMGNPNFSHAKSHPKTVPWRSQDMPGWMFVSCVSYAFDLTMSHYAITDIYRKLQEEFLSCQDSNPTTAWETISNFEKITREHGQTNWLVFPRVLVTKHWHILTNCNCSKLIPAQGWRLPN